VDDPVDFSRIVRQLQDKLPSNHLVEDEIKRVTYTILFSKPDYEAVLEQGDELIDYATNGASLGALKVADFLRRVQQGKVSRPQVWRDKHYPPAASGGNWRVPDPDQRYISFIYEVKNRFRKQLEKQNLLTQAVVIPERKVTAGTIVTAIAPLWLELVEMIKADPSFMYCIDPRRWEEIVAGAYTRAGFDEVILTPASGDFGRDVIAIKRGIYSIRIIDQVKAYAPGHLVVANDVRALLGVLSGDQNASKGIVTTTSDFAPKLREDPFIKPFIPFRLELINGKSLVEHLTKLASNCDEK
jgi:restriction system protein